jgi:hypothetical protein
MKERLAAEGQVRRRHSIQGDVGLGLLERPGHMRHLGGDEPPPAV